MNRAADAMARMTATDPVSAAGEPQICVIGAGPCGLTTIKNLRAAGFRHVTCFDEGEQIGGNWVFSEQQDRPSVYECTHIISSKKLSQFEDFPMPDDFPDFPSHRQIVAYFEDYATAFGLRPHIRLKTHVERAVRGDDGRWSMRWSSQDQSGSDVFDYLFVCSGHHREPYVPEYPGTFSGTMMHSGTYRRAEPLRGQRVLVVGGGNSACDIAVDISRVARTTCISMRHGVYIVPKLLFGQPTDRLVERVRSYLPKSLLQFALRTVLRMFVGSWKAYGLPQPTCGPLEMHPTLNSTILEALRSGTVLARPGITRFDGEIIEFSDGRKEPFDTVLWATGFHMSFPFLAPEIVGWPRTQPPPLYLKMMHADIPNLYFIGLFQPLGCIWSMADYQARIAAQQIVGTLERPKDIRRRIANEVLRPHWHFTKSPRHAIEVDARFFRQELIHELGRANA